MSVEILADLIERTPLTPLPNVFIQHAFLPLMSLLSKTEESAILLSGTRCCMAFIRKASNEITQLYEVLNPTQSYSSGVEGRSGIEIILQFVNKLLTSEGIFLVDPAFKKIQKILLLSKLVFLSPKSYKK